MVWKKKKTTKNKQRSKCCEIRPKASTENAQLFSHRFLSGTVCCCTLILCGPVSCSSSGKRSLGPGVQWGLARAWECASLHHCRMERGRDELGEVRWGSIPGRSRAGWARVPPCPHRSSAGWVKAWSRLRPGAGWLAQTGPVGTHRALVVSGLGENLLIKVGWAALKRWNGDHSVVPPWAGWARAAWCWFVLWQSPAWPVDGGWSSPWVSTDLCCEQEHQADLPLAV